MKVIFTLAFILAVGLTPSNAWPAYIFFLTLMASLILVSRLGWVFVIKRSVLVLPFILAAFPLIFWGPSPLFHYTLLPGLQISISPAGIERFAGITFKSWLSVQAAILLASTTRFPDLLTAFAHLRVPDLFIAIIGLMWRYLFVISDEMFRMMHARACRSAGIPGNGKAGGSVFWRATVTGGMAGSLFLRSLDRSERVYAAMLSRGYNGQQPEKESLPLTWNERRILVLGITILAFIWAVGLLSGG